MSCWYTGPGQGRDSEMFERYPYWWRSWRCCKQVQNNAMDTDTVWAVMGLISVCESRQAVGLSMTIYGMSWPVSSPHRTTQHHTSHHISSNFPDMWPGRTGWAVPCEAEQHNRNAAQTYRFPFKAALWTVEHIFHGIVNAGHTLQLETRLIDNWNN